MTKFAIVLAGLATAVAAVPAAAAPAPLAPQAWQTINQRQNNLYNRINLGIRNGALNRNEAARLRVQFNDLARLEAQYRRTRPGLTLAERRDLDRRFDTLSRRVYTQKHDRQTGWRR